MLQWNSEKLIEDVTREATFRVNVAALYLTEKIKENISVPVFPRSLPGNFPHMETGELRESIVFDIVTTEAGVEAVVSSSIPYADYLERGTRTMAARPFFRRTFLENEQYIVDVMANGV